MPRPTLARLVGLALPCLAVAGLALSSLLPVGPTLKADEIEAVRGKRYTLARPHGPWTILVASFQDVPKTRIEVVRGEARAVPNEEYVEGRSAYEAADELVYELRKYGVPAYTFEQKAEFDEARTIDRLRRERTRRYTSKKRNIAVLAGNYPSAKDPAAQQTLKLVKRFHPEFLSGGAREGDAYTTHTATGAAFQPTPGQPSPLSGAFLTMNPLLTPAEARQRSGRGSLQAARFNTGNEYNLAKHQGQYTIRVATFQGRSTAHAFGAKPNENFFQSDGSSLDIAAESARKIAHYMREKGTEAYVHHEQFQSIVTVGTFDSPNDPRIPRIIQFFAPKPTVIGQTGETRIQPEILVIPAPVRTQQPETFVMDPEPILMPVPRF